VRYTVYARFEDAWILVPVGRSSVAQHMVRSTLHGGDGDVGSTVQPSLCTASSATTL